MDGVQEVEKRADQWEQAAKKLSERVEALERLKRDVTIGIAVTGACLVAFLGYQSFVGIPKAIEGALNQTAVQVAAARASEYSEAAHRAAAAASDVLKSQEESVRSWQERNKDDLQRIVAGVPLIVKTSCKSQITLYLRYRGLYGAWYTAGPWLLDAVETALSDDGIPVVLTSDTILFHAESANTKWAGDTNVVAHGTGFKMLRYSLPKAGNNYALNLNCVA